MKLHEKPGKSTEVKINIAIMTKREGDLVVKRGVTLPVTVRTNIKYNEFLKKAVKKHHFIVTTKKADTYSASCILDNIPASLAPHS